MKERLLDYLVCPDCQKEFKLSIKKLEGNEIIEGGLSCLGCAKKYPIADGIPRLLKDNQSKLSKKTANNFAYSWSKVWRLSKADEMESSSYFETLLKKDDFKDKVILDAGCGNGRITHFVARYATRDVIGFDLSNSVEVAFKNTRNLNNVHIVQTDVYSLSFKKQYDFIYCIGVLHHLPEPEQGFKNLVNLLKGGGQILAWVYGKEGNSLYLNLFEPLRRFTSRMPLLITRILAGFLAAISWVIIKLVYVPLAKMGCGDRLPLGKYLISFTSLGFRQFRATVFDKMIPPISNYYTKEEFRGWFQNQGLKDIQILERNNNSWRGLGRLDKTGGV